MSDKFSIYESCFEAKENYLFEINALRTTALDIEGSVQDSSEGKEKFLADQTDQLSRD